MQKLICPKCGGFVTRERDSDGGFYYLRCWICGRWSHEAEADEDEDREYFLMKPEGKNYNARIK